jgi:hypothetical protein
VTGNETPCRISTWPSRLTGRAVVDEVGYQGTGGGGGTRDPVLR